MKKALKVSLVLSLFLVSFLAVTFQPTNASSNAASLSCPGEVRIGNVLSCKATGLTVGTNYIVIGVHSDGNVSSVKTAVSSTEYFRLTFTSADSDGIVPVIIDTATAAGAQSGTDDDTALVNLINPANDIPSSFFQNLLSAVLIIGIFGLLMSAFIIYKRR